MGDSANAIFIFLVFGVILGQTSYMTNVKEVQANWPKYRCNPAYMPFAATFAPPGTNITASENLSYCLTETMQSLAPNITAPLKYVQDMTLNVLSDSANANESTLDKTDQFKFDTGLNFLNVFENMGNVATSVQVLMIKMLDSQQKLTGIIATVLNMMTTVQFTFQSMWDGIPGQMIRGFEKIRR
jgi:hypothetical protein